MQGLRCFGRGCSNLVSGIEADTIDDQGAIVGTARARRAVDVVICLHASRMRRAIEQHPSLRTLEDLEPTVGTGEEGDGEGVPPARPEPDIHVAVAAVGVAVEGKRGAVEGEVGLPLALGAGDEASRIAERDNGKRRGLGRTAVTRIALVALFETTGRRTSATWRAAGDTWPRSRERPRRRAGRCRVVSHVFACRTPSGSVPFAHPCALSTGQGAKAPSPYPSCGR